MTIASLDDLTLIDSPVHYRRRYTATALLTYGHDGAERAAVAFSLEHTPYGRVEIRVELRDNVNYPLLPIYRELKRHIYALEQEGRLP